MPFKTIYKALAQPGVTEVLVAVGVYPVSGKMGQPGELVVPTGVTVRGGYLVVDGTMTDTQTDHPESIENQTILQGDSSCRIAVVGGILENVTVAGGRTKGQNGGGVYVEPDGVVRNCIVRNNSATGGKVKVGDLFMENSAGFYFLSMQNFQIELKEQLVGVVFWVNPNDNVPDEEKGKVIAFATQSAKFADKNPEEYPFSTPSPLYYPTSRLAMRDLDGERNTIDLLTYDPTIFPLTKSCRDYRSGEADAGRWYMPACGEVMQMYAEWLAVNNTFKMVWDKMTPEERMPCFNFPTRALANRPWEVAAYWYGTSLYTSTLFSDQGIWVYQSPRTVGVLFKEQTGRSLWNSAGVMTYPIRKF